MPCATHLARCLLLIKLQSKGAYFPSSRSDLAHAEKAMEFSVISRGGLFAFWLDWPWSLNQMSRLTVIPTCALFKQNQPENGCITWED